MNVVENGYKFQDNQVFVITQLPNGQVGVHNLLPLPELNLLLDKIKFQIVNPPQQSQIVVPPPGMKVG